MLFLPYKVGGVHYQTRCYQIYNLENSSQASMSVLFTNQIFTEEVRWHHFPYKEELQMGHPLCDDHKDHQTQVDDSVYILTDHNYI